MSSEDLNRANSLIARVIADKFRLRACVGVGSSGTVYRADQMTLGRTVAVKILNEDLARDPRLVKRFHDEALAASRLNHPNTVSVIDYGQTTDGLLYLVMEYLRGPTLTQLVQHQFPIGAQRSIELVQQVLTGLEEAHHAGVVHADLKADNIVVDQRRGGELVKVVDFGIARLVSAPSQTDERSICGTPEYMAPEVITGADPSFASDLYAVGVVLYELLVGQTPFAGGSTMEILTRHLRAEVVPPSVRRPELGIPPSLDAAVLRSLAKRPGERFEGAVEMRHALAQVLHELRGEPRAESHADEVSCSACGAVSSSRFRYCPECGAPRQMSAGIGSTTEVAQTVPAGVAANVHEAPRVRMRTPRGTGDIAPEGLLPLPLVGRGAALEQLLAFLEGRSGGSSLILCGAPGSGRSRLLREAYVQAAGPSGVVVYQAGPDPAGLATSYYPVRAMVAAILDLPPLCGLEEIGAALDTVGLGQRDLPGIAELFGQQSDLWQLEPPVRRRELLAATIRVLRAAGLRGPTALVFENVDQFDQPSQELLWRLCDRDDSTLRVVITSAVAFAAQWTLQAPRIELTPLDPAALEELAAHLGRRVPQGLMPSARELGELTGGVPEHVEQLVRYLIEGGVLASAPHTIGDVVAARIALLAHDPLVVCQAAAVCGNEIDRELLRQLTRGEVTSFDVAVETLRGRGILRDEQGAIGFEASVVREVAYDATPADVRRSLHAAAVAEMQSSIADPALLGHHHDLAGNRDKASEYLMRAGDVAVHQLDDAGASMLYQRALMAARQSLLGGSDEPDTRLRFVTLSVKLADSLRAGGELSLARGVVEEAKIYSDSPFLDAQLLRASAHLASSDDHTTVAMATLRRAIGLSIQTGKMDLVAELYLDLSALLLQSGESDAAARELEEGVDLVTLSEGATAKGGPPALWRLLMRLAQLRSALGDMAGALHLGECALMHARRINSRLGSARVQSMLAADWDRAGNSPKADRYRQAAVDEMRRLGDRRGTAELLLAGTSPTRTLPRISASSLREARELADEVGWTEGVDRALDAAR